MADTDSKGSNARIIVELRANHGNVASYANPSNRGARSSSVAVGMNTSQSPSPSRSTWTVSTMPPPYVGTKMSTRVPPSSVIWALSKP
jgi:hypothetical protein